MNKDESKQKESKSVDINTGTEGNLRSKVTGQSGNR